MSVEICDDCKKKMPYAVMRRESAGEWHYHTHLVIGKDAAYEEMRKAKREAGDNTLEWKVLPRNVADAMVYGMKLGKTLAAGSRPPRPRRRALVYLPEHL